MATTAQTIFPFAAARGIGGTSSVPTLSLPIFDTAILKGDVLIFNGTNTWQVDEDNSAPTELSIVGVAGESADSTNGAQGDPLGLIPAYSWQLFEGNVMNNVTDDVGANADHLGIQCGIQNSTQGDPAIEINDTTNKVVQTLTWAKQMNSTQDADPISGGVGVTNPRVVFFFCSSIWNPVAIT